MRTPELGAAERSLQSYHKDQGNTWVTLVNQLCLSEIIWLHNRDKYGQTTEDFVKRKQVRVLRVVV